MAPEIKLETFDAQNRIARIDRDLYLNVNNPTIKIKRQYAKVRKLLVDLHNEIDILNDIIEGK